MRRTSMKWSCAIAAAVWATLVSAPLTAVAAPGPEKVAHLGILVGSLEETLRHQLKLGRGVGLQIEQVVNDSPADKAGVKVHDVLEKVGDQILFNREQLTALVRSHAPGDKIALGLIREGEHRTLDVTLGETEAKESLLPEGWDPFSNPQLRNLLGRNVDRAREVYEEAVGGGKPVTFLGVELAPVDESLSAQLGIEEGSGALVGTVVDDSPAAKAGLQRHDVVVEMDGNRVKGPGDLSARIRDHKKGDQVRLEILRGGKPQEVEAVLSEKAATDPFKLRTLFENYRVLPRVQILKAAPGEGHVIVDLKSDEAGGTKGIQRRIVIRGDGSEGEKRVHVETSTEAKPSVHSVQRKVMVIKADDGTTTTVTEENGKRSVTVKDAQDKILFDGPANTPDERQKLPSEAREGIEKLEQQLESIPKTENEEGVRELRLPPPPTAPDAV